MTASLWLLAGDASTLCAALQLEQDLSDDERRQVGSFGSVERRAQYTAARAVLRRVLSAALGVPSRDIALEIEPSGRPRLHAQHQSTVSFSISHTQGLVCVAVHPASHIGVDAEPASKPRDVAALAFRFFHPRERDYVIAATSDAEARSRFLQCWTLKEAWFKAFSASRSLVLSELGFDFTIPERIAPVHTDAPRDLRLWSATFAEHVLALAWQGVPDAAPQCWRLDPNTLQPETVALRARQNAGTA